MTRQIKLQEALDLVSFTLDLSGNWLVKGVNGSVYGDIHGNVIGNIDGSITGTIRGRQWKFIETPQQKLRRLVMDGCDKAELLAVIDQMEEDN